MAKKDKKKGAGGNQPSQSVSTATPSPVISRRGWKTIAAGIVLLVVGYALLSLTDQSGQNWASSVSPLVILIGYAVIAIGILVKDPASSV